MKKCSRCAAVILLLAFSFHAYAIALIPTKVRNDCPVAVRIVVTRLINCIGPEKDQSGTWTIETTLAPGENGTLLLMGGAHEMCSSGLRSITIETAPTARDIPGAVTVLPVSITDNFPDHWSFLHVQVDTKSNQFVLRAVESRR